MSLFFLLILVLLGWLLQRLILDRCPDWVEIDHMPSRNVVEPDEWFEIIVTVRNRARLPVPYLRIEEHIPEALIPRDADPHVKRSTLHEWIFSRSAWIRPGETVEFHLPVRAEARGRYLLANLQYVTGDLLGISENRRSSPRLREVVVAPRERDSGDLPERLSGFLGQVSVRRFLFEDPVLTSGFREYTGHEPMKQIAWLQSARGQGLMVRQYDHTAEPMLRVFLNVDSRQKNQKELVETCCELARSVCRQLEENHISYGFHTNAVLAGLVSDEVRLMTESYSTAHFSHILEILGRVLPEAGRSFSETLTEISGNAPASSGWILITPSRADPEQPDFLRFRQDGSAEWILITAEPEP